MKKLVSVLMCLTMVLSLFSCRANDRNDDILSKDEKETNDVHNENPVNEETEDNQTSTYLSTYQPVLNVYRLAIDNLNRLYRFINQNPQGIASELFGLESSTEKEWFLSIIDAIFDFYGGHGEENSISPHHKLSCGYAIKDLNGDGVDELVLLTRDYMVCAIFSVTDGHPILLRHYRTRDYGWIDGDGSIHENGSSGAAYSTIAVYKIADGGAAMELVAEFGTNGVEWVGDTAHTVYYKLVNGEKVNITEAEYATLDRQYGKYLGYDKCAEATKVASGLKFLTMYTEAEIAMQMYESAIKDEISVFDAHLGEIKLKSLHFSSNDTRFEECKLLTKAILDLDQDGVNEYVIKSPDDDHIVLHYYNGKVYSYCFDSNDFCNLSTDGTFYWNNSSVAEDWKGGLNQIVFDGETVFIKSIYSIQYSNKSKVYYYETDYYDYYINGEAVTKSEFWDFHPYKKRMPFTPFEPTCSHPITAEQAWNFANTYWNHADGSHDGGAGTLVIYKVVLLDTPNSDTNFYRIGLQAEFYSNFDIRKDCNPPRNIQIYEQILVDAITGDVTEYVEPEADGK